MQYISVILSIFIFYCIGFAVLQIIKVQLSSAERVGISFGLGSGLVSFQMFVYVLCSIPLDVFTLCLPWIIFLLIYGIVASKQVSILLPHYKLSFTSVVLFILIVITIMYVFFQSQLRPLQAWDAVANWSFLSKATFIDKTIDGEFYQFANFDIPYLVSFQEAFIYFIHGSVIDREVLLIFPFYYISLLFLFYVSVRKFLSKNYSLLFTFLLASLPNLLRQAGTYDIGYVDISLAYYMFVSIVLLIHVLDGKKERGLFLLLGIFVGFTTLVKGEGQGFAMTIAFVVTVYLYKTKMLSNVLYFVPGIILFISWKNYSITQEIPTHYLYSGKVHLSRFFIITRLYGLEFINVVRWNFLWMALFVAFLMIIVQKKMNILLSILVLQLFFYMGIYLYTPLDVVGHIQGSFDRFLLQISPLALYIVASVYSNKGQKYEKN